MAEPSVISVKNVSKNFRFSAARSNTLKSMFTSLMRREQSAKEVQHALKGVSFEIKEGEFFGIVGRNGSGKSTLLKILAGIYQPNKGQTAVRGRLVPFIELGVGFNPELTGRENVYLNGALLNFSKKEIDGFYDEVVEFAELGQFMDKKLKNYSSGMQVRLAFSMAIRARADILVIDEVLAVGDADFQRKCYNYFKQLKKSKTTVVFVTHDMDAVRQFCDRAMLIENGTIAKIGEVDKIALSYTKLFMAQGDQAVVSGKKNKTENLHDLRVTVGKDITVAGKLTPKMDLDHPLLGFVVKDAAGRAVLGANSKMIHKKLGILSRAHKYDFSWEFPNILSDGEYTIDIAIVADDGVTIIEWWSDAVGFRVKKPTTSPYPITTHVTLEIKETK